MVNDLATVEQTEPGGDEASKRDVGAVVNAIRILQFLAVSPRPAGVAMVARETGISPSTCFNILRTLARSKFVVFRETDKTYALGLGVSELAIGLVGVSHADLIRPELDRLVLNYDMLIVLWRITDDHKAVQLDRAFSKPTIRVDIQEGARHASLVGAIGRCVAATLALSEPELRQRFAQLRWQMPPTFKDYAADVARAGQQGYAFDKGNLYRGVQSVASVVVDRQGKPRFAISGTTIVGQHDEDTMERLGCDLREVARYVGTALFGKKDAHHSGP